MADIPKLSPAALVIFGITGDLARRKLLPALYHLAEDKLLPENLQIIGVTRRGITVDALLDDIRERVTADHEPYNEEVLQSLGKIMQIITMDISNVEEYARLKQALDDYEARMQACMHRLFYLSVPSQTFASISQLLGEAGLHNGCEHGVGESRLLIEKPFGYDLESAKALIATLSQQFSEEQVYRVDHYLAKETAQNILTFRFSNPLFKAVWDSNTIQSVMVTAAEEIGIEGRATFYEQTGALRDIIQSHLLQLLALVTMEQPKQMSSANIHAEKLKLLQSIRAIERSEVSDRAVRGQYEGYRAEVENESSTTETFAALRLQIDTPRWSNVPVLLRTGKAMAEKVTEITLVFNDTENTAHQNTLTLRIQPNEGISLELQTKKPGFENQIERVQMDFCYSQKGGDVHPDAYERVLVDAMRGDKTLFATSEEVLAAWRVVENVVQVWASNSDGIETYAKGSWGAKRADELAEQAGTSWTSKRLRICPVHTFEQSK